MKKLLTFLAGFISGAVAYHLYLIIGLFRKCAQPENNDDEYHEWTRDELEKWQKWAKERLMSLSASLADTQPIEVKP